jgi:sugar phosphate isomerase/epimerase
MHAKDAASDPENIIFPPLGEGEINYDALIGTMAASGFDGYIAVEYEAFAWDFSRDHTKVLAQEKAFVDRLVAKHW